MNEPNPDDPLMEEISQQYKSDRQNFQETAKNWTRRYAAQIELESTERNAAVGGEKNREEKKQCLNMAAKVGVDVDTNVASKPGSSVSTTNGQLATSQSTANRPSASDSKPTQAEAMLKNNSVTRAPSKATNNGQADVEDVFNSSFEVEEDVGNTSAKTKKPSKGDDDSFSDMNDSDLDLFDFEESPLKKKPKRAL